MFTGIVEELGEVVEATGTRLAVRGPLVTSDAAHGDSIAVDGCCLTVASLDGDVFTADVLAETLRRTSLGALAPGDRVNLERPMALGARLGGHLVQGHVDATAPILDRAGEVVRIGLPAELARYLVPKGSITVDGVSLTVVEVADGSFTVSLIPTTMDLTTLGRKGIGDPVNLEADVVAKYVERMLEARR